MPRQRFVAFALPAAAWVALACAIVATESPRAQGNSAPNGPSQQTGAPDDPIQEGRDGMRILGTITVAPGAPRPTTVDEDPSAPLSADRMAWKEAAKNAYAARQYLEARNLFRRAAQADDPEAQMTLGQMAERGQGGPKDLEEALGWYAVAAGKGVSGASRKVAALTDQLRRQAQSAAAPSEPQEPPAGRAPSPRTADSSAPRAQVSPPRQQRAESLTPRPAPEVTAAEPLPEPPRADQPARTAEAAPSQPDAPDSSRGESGDEQQASLPESLQAPNLSEPIAPLPKRAPSALSAEVKDKLDQARALESDKGVAKSEAKAIELYKSIADQSAEAAFDLGWRYAAARGVKRDDKEAARYYRIAADKGYAPAQNNLGVLLSDGRGVKRNDEEAVDWYRRAALQDFAPAQVNLALMYGKGRGVEQSDANAMAWYSRAAKSGYGPATASLAMMYSEGKGVPQDQKTADFLMESAKGASPVSGLVSVEP